MRLLLPEILLSSLLFDVTVVVTVFSEPTWSLECTPEPFRLLLLLLSTLEGDEESNKALDVEKESSPFCEIIGKGLAPIGIAPGSVCCAMIKLHSAKILHGRYPT